MGDDGVYLLVGEGGCQRRGCGNRNLRTWPAGQGMRPL